MGKGLKKFALGAVIAAAAGYVAGILTAPKSGKETRKDIKDTAVKAYSTAEKELKLLHTELTKTLDSAGHKLAELKGDAKEGLEKAAVAAKAAKEKARHLLSVMHEGDANDHDLKQALEEAKKSAEHLKSFLKK